MDNIRRAIVVTWSVARAMAATWWRGVLENIDAMPMVGTGGAAIAMARAPRTEPNWKPAMPALMCPDCQTMLAEDPADDRAVICVSCGYADAKFAVPQ